MAPNKEGTHVDRSWKVEVIEVVASYDDGKPDRDYWMRHRRHHNLKKGQAFTRYHAECRAVVEEKFNEDMVDVVVELYQGDRLIWEFSLVQKLLSKIPRV